MKPTRATAKPAATKPKAPRARGIVSSSHLVSPRSVELSEFEFGMIVAWNAFSRWAMRCMAASGCPDLTITDVLVHARGQAKRVIEVQGKLSALLDQLASGNASTKRSETK